MRVLIYSPYSLRFNGGGERWIVEVALRLSLLKHEVVIVTTRFGGGVDSSFDSRLTDNFCLTELPFLKLPYLGLLFPIPVYFRKLNRLFKSADVVYFNNVFPFQELIMLAAKLIYKKPIINMYQSPIYSSGRRTKLYQSVVSSKIVRFFDAQHVLNEADRQVLTKWKAKNIHYIPNGVSTDKFVPSGISSGAKFKVLFVGRLNYHKGFDILLELIGIIYNNQGLLCDEDVEFSIIGNGFFKSPAQDLQKRYRNVEYIGQIKHEALPEFYAYASLLIMPSRWEGMPLVALEAQSCGLPIVASDIPGLREIAFNNKSITLVNKKDPAAFMEAVCKHYSLWKYQRENFESLRQSARNNAQTGYDWNKIMPLIIELLLSLV